MTMVSVPPLFAFASPLLGGSRYTIQLNSVNEAICYGFTIPFTGTLTHIIFATGTVTTGATVDIRLETSHATNHTPSGTLYHASAAGTLAIANGDDNVILEGPLNGGTGISVTAGDYVFAIIKIPGSCDLNILGSDTSTSLGAAPRAGLIWGADQTGGGTYSFENQQPCFALRYATTGIVPVPGAIGPSISGGTESSTTASTNPDEIGNRFILPYKARISGAIFRLYVNSGTPQMRLRCRDASGTLLSSSAQFSIASGSSVLGMANIAAGQEIAKNTEFSLSIESVSTGEMALWYSNYTTNAEMANDCAGLATYKVAFNNGGSRSTTDTRRLAIYPIIDQIDDGDGAGAGGLSANALGGFVS